jgi:hypothetical protein
MSDKVYLFPRSSTCETPLRSRIGDSSESSPANLPDADLQDMKFLRSWLVYDFEIQDLEIQDSEIQISLKRRRVGWNLIAGIALSFAVSAGFWAGIGLMIARLWK